MKRLDRKTDRLMTRIVLPLFFAVLLAAPLLNRSADARDTPAQHWMPTKNISLSVDNTQPAGDSAVGTVSIDNFQATILFDPRQLDDSHFGFSARFVPTTLPGNRKMDDELVQSTMAQFLSEEIKKTSDTTFDVQGYFRMNNRTQLVIFPMTVTGATIGGKPALTFSGRLLAPAGASSPMLGLPKQIPVAFTIETVAAP